MTRIQCEDQRQTTLEYAEPEHLPNILDAYKDHFRAVIEDGQPG